MRGGDTSSRISERLLKGAKRYLKYLSTRVVKDQVVCSCRKELEFTLKADESHQRF